MHNNVCVSRPHRDLQCVALFLNARPDIVPMQMRITRSRILQKLGVDSIDVYPPVRIDMECNFVIQDVIKYMESNVRARNAHHDGHHPSLI
jgi:hypothetical protein